MHEEPSLSEIQKGWHISLKSYIIGFSLSLLLTFIAFYIVAERLFSDITLIISVVGLGILQAVLQILFFMHITKETKPRWESLVFLCMVMVLVIVVIGSLWIIHDLNYRVMDGMNTIFSEI